MATALGQMHTHAYIHAHTCECLIVCKLSGVLFCFCLFYFCLFLVNIKFSLALFSSHSSKKVESEGGASAAKKDSKRKREPSVSDDVEVKSPPPSPPEDDDDDGVQVRAATRKAGVLKHVSTFQAAKKKYSKSWIIL